jgi:hypothetical protein
MDLAERVAAIVGRPVVSIAEIPGAGGYTPALRRIATLADGTTMFVKAAVDDMTRGWLESEARSYAALAGAPFVPGYVGAADGVLVLEDLRHGHWPPPWRPGDIDRAFEMLDELAATPPPPAARDLEAVAGPMLRNWAIVAADPAPFLGLGLCSAGWLDDALPVLVEADATALAGDALVHFDVRSDNLCLLEDRVVLVDWNHMARGEPSFDGICLAQGITGEGGPLPEHLVPDAQPGIVAMIAGYFAERAPQPVIPTAPRVRIIQLEQLRVTLPWAARLLGLPPPTPAPPP